MTPNLNLVQNIDNRNYSADVQEVPHGRIHAGHHHTASYSASAVGSGTTLNAVIEPATGKTIHVVLTITCFGPWLVKLIKGSTGVSAGSVVTPTNNNWLSANAALWSLRTGATVSTPGTTIPEQYYLGGTGVGQSVVSGGGQTRLEYVITDTTPLHIALTSNAVGGNMAMTVSAYDVE